MSYEEKFAAAEASREPNVFTRIDATHPVELFLGLEGFDRAIMVICPQRPPEPPTLAAIAVDVRLRQDNSWALVLRLLRAEFKTLFERLVADLEAATRQNPENPGEVVIARLSRWQRLLSRGQLGILDDHQLRGLCAEISFLADEAIRVAGPGRGVAAWHGPHDGPRDFVFEDVEVEVKAIRPNSREVSISSLEQLTDAGKPLFLWVRPVDIGRVRDPDPASVAALVQRVRAATAGVPTLAEDLDFRLGLAGYEDRSEYARITVSFGSVRCYRVSQGFPRIERASAPPGIVACQYRLLVASIESFRAGSWVGESK